jgi:hypothetical protein
MFYFIKVFCNDQKQAVRMIAAGLRAAQRARHFGSDTHDPAAACNPDWA